MKLLKKVLNFYINASIHVAFAVYSLVIVTELYLKLPYNKELNWFIFFATITGYNFIKYAGIAKLHHKSLTENLKIIQIFSLICFVLTAFFGAQLEVKMMMFFLPFIALTLLYAIPFLKGFSMNLRNVSAIKSIVIALVWAGVTVLLPVLAADVIVDLKIIVHFLQRFLLVIILMIPFDIRDLKFDHKNLQTLPQILGVERVKKFGFILLTIIMILEFFITPDKSFKSVFLAVFFMMLILLQRAKRKQSKYYASFWVEAVPIFWVIFLFIIIKK